MEDGTENQCLHFGKGDCMDDCVCDCRDCKKWGEDEKDE